MSNQKVYWKGLEELHETPDFVKSRDNEFVEPLPMDEFLGQEELGQSKTGRRDFLKFLGFSVTAAAVAACETPINKALPYVIKPENVTPGVPNYYASTFFDDDDFANILVKTREGRPILIEGANPMTAAERCGISGRVSASVLGLYDTKRNKDATRGGQPIAWTTADKEIGAQLAAIAASGKKTVVLTSTVISPSTKKAIAELALKYTNVEHVQHDVVSYSALPKANAAVFGKAVIPAYRFDKALAIATFGADFLGTWLDHNAYEGQFSAHRDPKGEMSRVFAFEAIMSLSGANADYRSAIKQSEIAHALIGLYNRLSGQNLKALPTSADAAIAKCADYLKGKKGQALVVCGLNDVNAQIITAEINKLLGAEGTTIDFSKPLYTKQGDEAKSEQLFKDIIAGNVQGLIVYGANPVYNHPEADKIKGAIAKLKLSVSFAESSLDETAEVCQYILPDHHYLESWNDFNPYAGHYAISQPTIHPLFNTRQGQENFLVWAGLGTRTDKNSTVYRDYMKKVWNETLFAKQTTHTSFEDFWSYSVHDGAFLTTQADTAGALPVAGVGTLPNLNDAAAKINATYKPGSGVEVVLYQKIGIGTGNQANNPWLQEFPDPISRVTWDNYVTMSPAEMAAQKLETVYGQERPANLVEVSVNGKTIKLPAVASPGQAPGTVGIAIGYGRKFGKSSEVIGQNAYPFVTKTAGETQYHAFGATLTATTEMYAIASTQTHHTMMGRDIVKETSYKQYKENPASGNHKHTFHTNLTTLRNGKETHGHLKPDEADFWKKFDRPNHNWGLTIDLNACTGCGACVIACHAENNVPVVGKDEIRRVRDMHWMRIDRYYTSDTTKQMIEEAKGLGENLSIYGKAENPSETPQVVFQPIMCQHCSQAPCETVCPVLATTHSNEGLNQMTYNRCIGTRYCANNCPYKVRRFNWFKYHDNEKFDFYMNDDLGKMVLNPDVTVRSRGVMEKCSMCVQRIQYGKLEAKKDGRRVKDGDIMTPCQTSCSMNAINFGDFNDQESYVHRERVNERSYALLEEVGTEPNVFYQVKVRNVDEEYYHGHEEAHAGGEHGGEHGGHEGHAEPKTGEHGAH